MIRCSCGYHGPRTPCTICRGKLLARSCSAAYCPRCGQYVAQRSRAQLAVERVLFVVFGFILAGALAHLLCGCGPEFRAADAQALTETAGGAGAGAGQGGAPSSAAGSSSSAGQGGTGGARAGALCSRVGWRVSAFAARADEPAAAMLDGDPATRWASGEPQAAGQWLELELGAPTVLEQLELRSAAGDMPAALELMLDGVPVNATASTPAPGVLDLVLEQASVASSARVTIVTPSGANWWSVLELGGVCQ